MPDEDLNEIILLMKKSNEFRFSLTPMLVSTLFLISACEKNHSAPLKNLYAIQHILNSEIE